MTEPSNLSSHDVGVKSGIQTKSGNDTQSSGASTFTSDISINY